MARRELVEMLASALGRRTSRAPTYGLAEGGAVYPLRASGRFVDPETFSHIRRGAPDAAALRRRLQELNYAGMHDPSTKTWMAFDPDNISFALGA